MFVQRLKQIFKDEKGMEMVQVAILVAIAIAMGIFFKTEISDFIKEIFENLDGNSFSEEI